MRLRTKVTVFFGVIALLATITLTIATYAFARSSLLEQRAEVAQRQAVLNAGRVLAQLQGGTEGFGDTFPATQVERGGFAFVRLADGVPFATDTRFSDANFPPELREAAAAGISGVQRFSLEDDRYVGVAIHIAEVDADYYEAFQLASTDGTLRSILLALIIGSSITVVLATGVGWWTSRRLLQPLGRITDAAGEIAAGDLDTRVDAAGDPDLDRLANSFNDMADAVQARIEREARFASDVSHELRSPLTTLAASIEVLEGRRDDLPDRAQRALDLLVADVRRFRAMVEDLLEISRFDAGAASLDLDQVSVPELVTNAVRISSHTEVPLEIAEGAEGAHAMVDKRRVVRVVANLLDNAAKYGGGATVIRVERAGGEVRVVVEDAGEGVPEDERERIFERFSRGTTIVGRRGSGEGVGLGLALVREHVGLHGGRVWVEGRADGAPGARFVVALPIDSLVEETLPEPDLGPAAVPAAEVDVVEV